MKESMLIVASMALLLAYLISHFNDPQKLKAKLDPSNRVNSISIPLDPRGR